MTTHFIPTPEQIEEDSAPEQRANVYLKWDGEDGCWTIDPVTLDGAPLDGLDGPDIDLDRDSWTPEIETRMNAAAKAEMPSAEELTIMLLSALPKESPVKQALSEITDAAGNWANELTTYIAKGSEEFRDPESAASQRESAVAITAALRLLRA